MAEGPRDALCKLNFCQLPHSCTKITFGIGKACNSTKHTIRFVSDSDVCKFKNMTSSTKPEVHTASHCRQKGPSHHRRQQVQNIVWNLDCVFWDMRADEQTNKQTHSHTDTQTHADCNTVKTCVRHVDATHFETYETSVYCPIKQGVALTGRNRTGPPCSVGRPTAHAPSGRPGGRPGDRLTTHAPGGRPPARRQR